MFTITQCLKLVMADAEFGDVNNKTDINFEKIYLSPKKYKIVSKDYGIEAIDRALNNIYPGPENPVYISSPDTKIWNGGSLPLDCIKVFYNTGGCDFRITPHWHYVTYGFSDLHGDGKVHDVSERGKPSGYGFELTFRLKQEPDEKTPPAWPVTLLNNLSLYVFSTGIELTTFDHIPWFDALNRVGRERSNNPDIMPCPPNSYIDHMVVVDDPQVLELDTPCGTVQFLQIVGVLKEEFHYARSWKTSGIVDQLKEHPQVGPLLLTDINRKVSVFDLNPRLVLDILSKIEAEGTLLGQATCHVLWKEVVEEVDVVKGIEDLKLTNERDEFIKMKRVHLDFDANAGELLPIMLGGRLKHGLNFTFINPGCCETYDNVKIEFIPHNYKSPENVHVTANSPIKANVLKHHLQIFCGKAIIQKMEMAFAGMERLREQLETLPIRFMLKSAIFEITFSVHRRLKCQHTTSG